MDGGGYKSFYGRTQKETLDKADEFRRSIGAGLAFEADKLTFGEYLYRWLKDDYRGTVREITYARGEHDQTSLLPDLRARAPC